MCSARNAARRDTSDAGQMKTVLVTGAAGGIGRCTAREFCNAGYRVVITDFNEQALQDAERELARIGAEVHAEVVDVTSPEQVLQLARLVEERFGGLDILINNAGVGHHGELADTSLAKWRQLLDVNLLGALYHVYAFLPGMIQRKGGVIVNVSSGQAFFRLPTWGAYASIKAALGAFSEILHWEMRKHGIHVTTVYPFMVNTPFYQDVEGDTWGSRLSMKLLPLYSMTPEKVGRIIYGAALRHPKVEMVSILNKFAFYGRVVPGVWDLVSYASDRLLTKKAA